MRSLVHYWRALLHLQAMRRTQLASQNRSPETAGSSSVPSLPCRVTRGNGAERWIAKQIEKGRGRRLQPLGNWSHAARRSALSRSTALSKLQPARRRTTRPHGTSSLASAAMRDSPACTLRAVWDAARRPDAPVRRPRPAPRRRSLQQLRGAFMATPSCSPRRRRRGNRDRGAPAAAYNYRSRSRAASPELYASFDAWTARRSSGRSEDKVLLRGRRPAHNGGVVTWCRRRR